MSAKKTIFQKISEAAVQAKTNRVWQDWFSRLDKFGLKEKGHTQAAKYLRDKHGLSDWWAQAVTIRYEWERGLRRMKKSDPLDKSICPVCLRLYPASLARSEWPMCADCGSEAIDIDVSPLRQYLAEHSLPDLARMRKKWAASTEFRDAYKAEKLKRFDHLIELKRKSDSISSR